MQVEYMTQEQKMCRDMLIKTNKMLINTARVLLEAGCEIDGRERGAQTDFRALECLLDFTDLYRPPFFGSFTASRYRDVFIRGNQFSMIVALFPLLLKFGANPNPQSHANHLYYGKIIKSAARLAMLINDSKVTHMPVSVEIGKGMIICLGNLFRQLMLAEGDVDLIDLFFERDRIDLFFERDSEFTSVKCLMCIAGHADRFIGLLRLVQKALTATGVIRLRKRMSSILETARAELLDLPGWTGLWTLTDNDELLTFSDTTLDWIQGIQTPLRLQELARRAVTRTMSYSSLCEGASTLQIPTHLQKCVVLLD